MPIFIAKAVKMGRQKPILVVLFCDFEWIFGPVADAAQTGMERKNQLRQNPLDIRSPRRAFARIIF